MSFRALKPREYASTKDVVSRLYDEAGGLKRVAHVLERGLSQAAAYADPAETAQISFDQVRRVTSPAATAAAEDLAALAGGAFVPGELAEGSLTELFARSAEEWGQVVAEVMRAYGDGHLCARDRERIHREVDDVCRALMALRSRVLADRKE